MNLTQVAGRHRGGSTGSAGGPLGGCLRRGLFGALAVVGMMTPWALAGWLAYAVTPPPPPHPAGGTLQPPAAPGRSGGGRRQLSWAALSGAAERQEEGRQRAAQVGSGKGAFQRWLLQQELGEVGNAAEGGDARERLLGGLSWWLTRPPAKSAGAGCVTEAPQRPSERECAAEAHFSGRRSAPRTVVDVALFGYDLDALEIRWRELGQAVDYLAVVESPVSHQGGYKPLLFADAVRHGRFSFVRGEAVIHVALDGEEVAAAANRLAAESAAGRDFAVAAAQEEVALRRLRDALPAMLHSAWDNPGPDADLVLIWGDADEIASADAARLARWCRLEQPDLLPIDVASWMPMPGLESAWRPDWPVHPDLPFTFGNPRIARPSQARRGYGDARRWLLGGVHLSVYPWLPLVLIKVLQNAHGDGGLKGHEGVRRYLQGEDVEEGMRSGVLLLGEDAAVRARTTTAAELLAADLRYRRVINSTPAALLRCLRDRFPAWHKRNDPRTA